jgi:hypothetical protein
MFNLKTISLEHAESILLRDLPTAELMEILRDYPISDWHLVLENNEQTRAFFEAFALFETAQKTAALHNMPEKLMMPIETLEEAAITVTLRKYPSAELYPLNEIAVMPEQEKGYEGGMTESKGNP